MWVLVVLAGIAAVVSVLLAVRAWRVTRGSRGLLDRAWADNQAVLRTAPDGSHDRLDLDSGRRARLHEQCERIWVTKGAGRA